jgi:hypothetical protein
MNWAFEKDGQLRQLEGIGGLKNLKLLLEAAREDGSQAYVIVDGDPRAKGFLNDLVSARLLEKENYTLWQRNLEEDNFSHENRVTAALRVLEEKGLSVSKDELSSLQGIRDLMNFRKDDFLLQDFITKPDFAFRLLEGRLKEIRNEVAGGKYKPKLKVEDVLNDVYGKIFHAPLF